MRERITLKGIERETEFTRWYFWPFRIVNQNDRCKCTLCNKEYTVSKLQVNKIDGMVWVECKDHPKCSGTIADIVLI